MATRARKIKVSMERDLMAKVLDLSMDKDLDLSMDKDHREALMEAREASMEGKDPMAKDLKAVRDLMGRDLKVKASMEVRGLDLSMAKDKVYILSKD